MIVGVLSDTHLSDRSFGLPSYVSNALKGCGLIVHAGDHTKPWVVEELELLAPVKSVLGNCDVEGLAATVPMKRILDAGPFQLGVIHGWGATAGLEQRVRAEFNGVHGIIFGHSHIPLAEKQNGVWMLNPGSATIPRGGHPPSILRIDVGGEDMKPELVFF